METLRFLEPRACQWHSALSLAYLAYLLWLLFNKYFLCVRDYNKCFAYIPNFILTTAL